MEDLNTNGPAPADNPAAPSPENPALPETTPAASGPIAVGGQTFASVEELAKSFEEQKSLMGRHAEELGWRRKAMESGQPDPQPVPQAPVQLPPTFEQRLAEIDASFESGEISADQRQTYRDKAIVEASTEAAGARYAAERQFDQFRQDNPTYDQAVASGALKQFYQSTLDPASGRSRLGLSPNDPVGVYFAYERSQLAGKTQTLEQQLSAAKTAGFEEGKRQALAELQAKAGAGSAIAASATPPNAGQGMEGLPGRPMSADEAREYAVQLALRGS
jgi:uncharacterized protein YfiM (DUF2279 family)